ncbi:ribonuclease domain-containing protein [Streptomyces sp. NPDC005774]|uniref:ribonuclease domain-containing protein n=1 Tax=Streptomyces sp. NPDC005774 TaxID=3364728 RepID=UPI0036CF7223
MVPRLLPRLPACPLVLPAGPLLLTGCSPDGSGDPQPVRADGMTTVREAGLSEEARRTLNLIDAGGPLPYDREDVVLGGLERLPPRRERGCCHEYTVGTPGSADRGARRVVTGRGGERYCTDAPCASFRTVLG